MDWKEFISALAESLAWPISIFLMLLLVKEKIFLLVDKIGQLRFKDIEVDFEKVEKNSNALKSTIEDEGEIMGDSESQRVFSSMEQQILDTIETAPNAAIILAWSTLETAITSAVSRLSLSPESPSYRSPLHNIEMIEQSGKLSKESISLLHEMRILRNKITHDKTAMIKVSGEQALKYSKSVFGLVEVLNGLNRDRKKHVQPEGEWIKKPTNFEPYKKEHANIWNYSSKKINELNILAGVGPWSSNGDSKYECFSIDIEIPVVKGHRVIDEITMDLKYVSKDYIDKNASEIVEYDPEKNILTFDLGKSKFKYQIKSFN